MDDPNITIEDYIRLEEEKLIGMVRSVETEFPAIVFNGALTSEVALSCEPMVSPLNDNQIEFRISFDESDDEDYMVIYDKNSFSYKIISVNDLKMDSKNDNDKVNIPSSSDPTISYFDDFDYFKDFEKEFLAISYNDALTSKLDYSEPTISPQYIDEFDETSLSEYDDEEQNVIYFNDLFPFNQRRYGISAPGLHKKPTDKSKSQEYSQIRASTDTKEFREELQKKQDQKAEAKKKSSLITMTKVIKKEFEKLESLKISDDSFTCNTSFEFFYKEFNQMSIMDDDLFTYEVEIPGLASVPCDLNDEDDSEQQITHGSDVDMEYDLSNVEFTKWLASKFYNHKTMDQYTKNELCIYWTRGDGEVELTDEESSDSYNNDEVAENFRIETNVFDFETPTCRAFKEFNYLLQIDLEILTKDIDGYNGVWKEPTLVEHYCEPFSFKSGHSKWPTCSWKDDGYCNGGNFPGVYIVGNILRYQNLEWYEALKDGKLKDEALKNKSIMEGIIDEDDESHNEGWRRWDGYEEKENDEEHENEERCELFDNPHQKTLVCNIKRFEMIKYSFGEDEEYVSIKEHEYDNLTMTNEDACRAYQEIFHRMDEGWVVTRVE
ncbi:hypothetical protein Tco_1312711 [Tanacetum coccineum]